VNPPLERINAALAAKWMLQRKLDDGLGLDTARSSTSKTLFAGFPSFRSRHS
jgi:hypothetical protein